MKNITIVFLMLLVAFLVTTALAVQGGKPTQDPVPQVTAVPGKVSTPGPKIEKPCKKCNER